MKELIIDGEKFRISRQDYNKIMNNIDLIKEYRKEKNETYYFIGETGEICFDKEEYSLMDKKRYEYGNYFQSNIEASIISASQKLNRLLYLFSKQNSSNVNWDDINQKKYYIGIDKNKKTINVNHAFSNTNIGTVIFSSKEIAKKAIKKHEELFKKIYTGYTFNI